MNTLLVDDSRSDNVLVAIELFNSTYPIGGLNYV